MSSQGLDLNPVSFFGYVHQILISSPNRLEILGSLNQWWVCIPQNAHEACDIWGDTDNKGPGRKQYTQDAIGHVPWPKVIEEYHFYLLGASYRLSNLPT